VILPLDERGFSPDRLAELADEFEHTAETIRAWADGALAWQGTYEDRINELEGDLTVMRDELAALAPVRPLTAERREQIVAALEGRTWSRLGLMEMEDVIAELLAAHDAAVARIDRLAAAVLRSECSAAIMADVTGDAGE
jgi:hypothetical protein